MAGSYQKKLKSTNYLVLMILFLILLGYSPVSPLTPTVTKAAGFIDFEDGVDGQIIRSTIPGLRFITTNGQDWIYGDWRTGLYNGKYPRGAYTSNGNFFAWLGPNQGDGVIDFVGSRGATYLSVFVSTAHRINLTGYSESGELLASSTISAGNINTGRLSELRINAPSGRRFSYAIVSGIANHWLIDDLSTDAEGVPNQKIPLIFIPGIAGSRLLNGANEVWPNMQKLISDKDDAFLDNLVLDNDGVNSPPGAPQIREGDIIRIDTINYYGTRNIDIYQSLIRYLETRGYKESEGTLYVFPYDWRKDLDTHIGALDRLVSRIKSERSVAKVNILAHSMGGIIAKMYITDVHRAASIDTVVTLGTPYLGSPKAFAIMHVGECFISSPVFGGGDNDPSNDWWKGCFSNQERIQRIVQNFPGVYTLLPTFSYFDVYSHGYYSIDYDVDNDGRVEGALNFDQTEYLISNNHNGTILSRIRTFQQKYMSNGFRAGTNGVRVYQFVGDGESTPTPGVIREYRRRNWPRFWEWQVAYDIREVTGDGTVPLRSADLGRATGSKTDYSGSVNFFYVGLEHGGLAKYDENQRFTVLPRVADILEVRGAPSFIADALDDFDYSSKTDSLLLNSPSTSDLSRSIIQTSDIRTQPVLLRGRQLMLQGSAYFEVEDGFGNKLRVLPDGTIENRIPRSNHRRLGDSTSLFLPEGGFYLIYINGLRKDSLDLRIRTILNDNIVQTVLYEDIPILSSSRATLTYNTVSNPNLQIRIDHDNDGSIDQTVLPKRILDQTSSADVIAPTSSVTLTGAQDTWGLYTGQVTVTITASDNPGGSGLDRVEYLLNNQTSSVRYTGPFTVDAAHVQYIVVRAVDKAGNVQEPLTFVQVGPYRTYLPIIQRG